jgi:hypothetical protein
VGIRKSLLESKRRLLHEKKAMTGKKLIHGLERREREEEDPLQEKVRAIYLQSGAMPDRVSSNTSLISEVHRTRIGWLGQDRLARGNC